MKINKSDISKILILFGIWMRGKGLATAPINYDANLSILQYFIVKPFVWARAPWLIRIPGLLASILALAVIWEMLEDWQVTDNQRLWISALTLLPGFYWVAQDARIYSMMGLLYLLTFWLMMGGQYVWGSITMGLMIWSHPIGLILAISIVVVQLIRDWLLQGIMGIREVIYKSTFKHNVLSGLAGIAIGIPSIMFWPVADPNIMNRITLIDLFDNIHAAIFVKSLPSGWPNMLAAIIMIIYFILATLITFTAWAQWHKQIKISDPVGIIQDDIVITNYLLTTVPLILMIIVSVIIQPIIYYRPLMILLWPMILWVGSATAMQEYKPVKLILPGILAAVLIMSQLPGR